MALFDKDWRKRDNIVVLMRTTSQRVIGVRAYWGSTVGAYRGGQVPRYSKTLLILSLSLCATPNLTRLENIHVRDSK
jgi:hypothetical protein